MPRWKYTDEDANRRRVQSFLEGCTVIRRAPRPQPETVFGEDPVEARELGDDAFQLLSVIARNPARRLTEQYTEAGLDRNRQGKARKELEVGEYVRIHKMVKRTRGAVPQTFEVLAKGKEVLERHRVRSAPKLTGRGGHRHDIFARWVTEVIQLCDKETQITYEKEFGGKHWDILTRTKDGKRCGYEICCSGSAQYNAAQAIKAARAEAVLTAYILFEKPQDRDRTTTRLAEDPEYQKLREKLIVLSITQFHADNEFEKKIKTGAG